MQRNAKRLWLAGLLLLLVAAVPAFYWYSSDRTAGTRPSALVLMSSIDLQWGEADLGALARGEGNPDPLFSRLADAHTIIAVDNVAQLQASRARVAMLVQPRAFTPEELVRLDKWVRAGGRLLFFADPALQWPSDLPIGDPARPLFTSMHSPLFAHWGLELVLPMEPGAVSAETEVRMGRYAVRTLSAGQWQSLKNADGQCRIADQALLAECRPGKGQVLLVADADLLHASLWHSSIPGTDSSANIDWVEQLLDRLASGSRVVGKDGEILDRSG